MDPIEEWSTLAAEWARYWAPVARPAQLAIIAAAGVGPGSTVLDVGCGSGEFLTLLAQAGAITAGVDPAQGMVEIAQRANPSADVRVAGGERLPWPDDAFDLVTAVNTLAFTDVELSLRECARVGHRVAIANWAEDELNDLTDLERTLAGDDYEGSDDSREPQYLTELLREHGFTVETEQLTQTPMVLADADALVAALTFGESDERRAQLRAEVLDAAAPFRRPDGGYLLRNTFRWAVARR